VGDLIHPPSATGKSCAAAADTVFVAGLWLAVNMRADAGVRLACKPVYADGK